MAKSIKALFQNGVFKPLTKVRLKNRQRVELTVIKSEEQPKPASKAVNNRRPTARRLKVPHPASRIVGLFKSKGQDLAKDHDKYLYT